MGYSVTNSRGITYFLHKMEVMHKDGNSHFLYYFAQTENTEKACDIPEGREAVETAKTGLPVLKKV